MRVSRLLAIAIYVSERTFWFLHVSAMLRMFEETCHVVQTSEPSTVWRDARALQVSTIVFRRAWRPHFLALRKIASRYKEELHRVSAQLRTQPLLRNSAAKCSGAHDHRWV